MNITEIYKAELKLHKFNSDEYRKRLSLQLEKHCSYTSKKSWQEKRKLVLKRDNHRCIICGDINNLHIHHLHYQNVDEEEIKDLKTLCSTCHSKVHKGHIIIFS